MKNTNISRFSDETKTRDISKLEKPAVSVTVLIFTIDKGNLEILLVKRVREPFKEYWSIPGDLIYIDESLREAAMRVLQEKTGIKDVYLEQLYSFGEPNRDPRGRVITIAFFALLPRQSVDLAKTPDALHLKWTPINSLPQLAFDHEKIIEVAFERIKNKLSYSTIAQGLLPEKFRFSELQNIYEIILGKKIDKRNFRKKLTSLDLVVPTESMYKEGSHRPARLYKFKTKKVIIIE